MVDLNQTHLEGKVDPCEAIVASVGLGLGTLWVTMAHLALDTTFYSSTRLEYLLNTADNKIDQI